MNNFKSSIKVINCMSCPHKHTNSTQRPQAGLKSRTFCLWGDSADHCVIQHGHYFCRNTVLQSSKCDFNCLSYIVKISWTKIKLSGCIDDTGLLCYLVVTRRKVCRTDFGDRKLKCRWCILNVKQMEKWKCFKFYIYEIKKKLVWSH